MTEGWANLILSARWNIYSGDIETHGVNPKAIQAMKEVCIDISNYTSDFTDEKILQQTDLVVTLCSDADEKCPTLPPHIIREHWAFDDPAGKDCSEFQYV